MALVRNDSDHQTLKSGNFNIKYPSFNVNGTEYLIYPENGGRIDKKSPIFSLAQGINNNADMFFQKLEYMKKCESEDVSHSVVSDSL